MKNENLLVSAVGITAAILLVKKRKTDIQNDVSGVYG